MKKIISLSALVLGFAMTASANPPEGKGPHGACAKDVETLCAGVEPGQGAIMKCLKENQAKVSAECTTQMASAKEAMKDVRDACQDDMEKFCKDVKKGRGRIMKCMKKHKAELSASCKEEMEKKKGSRNRD